MFGQRIFITTHFLIHLPEAAHLTFLAKFRFTNMIPIPYHNLVHAPTLKSDNLPENDYKILVFVLIDDVPMSFPKFIGRYPNFSFEHMTKMLISGKVQ